MRFCRQLAFLPLKSGVRKYDSRYVLMEKQELAELERITRAAGALALSFFGKVEREEKTSATDLVTVADRDVEKFITSELGKAFPEDGIWGEEFGKHPGKSGRIWIVDPIDGTADFANNLTSWAVSIGLVEGEEAVAGFIFIPIWNRFYLAANGESFCNGKRLEITPAKLHPGYFFAANAGSPIDYRLDLNLRITAAPSSICPCLAADGAAVGAFCLFGYAWDFAASYPILKFAGGEFEYLSGGEFKIGDCLDGSRVRSPLLAGTKEFIDYARGCIVERG